jgi:hypothetical protein
MVEHQFLRGKKIAISISDTPDLGILGLSESHLRDAAIEVARYLVAAGAHLIYGGDLRAAGYTELLAEVVARHHRASKGSEIAFTNYLPWPSYDGLTQDELEKRELEFGRYARIAPVDWDGSDIPRDLVFVRAPARQNREWATGLSAMRRRTTAETAARIVLGGTIENYKGSMPGIAEETVRSLKAGKPTFVVGGFGGCAGRISMSIGLASRPDDNPWEHQSSFARFTQASLHNGLESAENFRLANTVHTDEIVALMLRGLRRALH